MTPHIKISGLTIAYQNLVVGSRAEIKDVKNNYEFLPAMRGPNWRRCYAILLDPVKDTVSTSHLKS